VALVWVLGLGVLRATFWAPEVCPTIPQAEARAAMRAGGDWLVRTQHDDGTYLYDYDRGADAEVPGYNIVRHAGVTMALYQLVGAGEEQFLAGADKGLQWMLDRLIDTGPGAQAFTNAADARVGASALMLVALGERRLATHERDHDVVMQALGRFLVGQSDGGRVLETWDHETRAPVPGITSRYATGEALLGLALLHEIFPESHWDEPSWPILDHLAGPRDREEELFPPPWPDQWAAYALAEMGDWDRPLEDHHIAYARRLAGRFGFIVRFDSQRGDALGRLTHGPDPRGAGEGTWVEGLASLYELSGLDERLADLRPVLRDRLACSAAVLAGRQVPHRVGDPRNARTEGAWFYAGRTRMDDQQHAASGLLGALPVLEEHP
jgi:hypothetical protein